MFKKKLFGKIEKYKTNFWHLVINKIFIPHSLQLHSIYLQKIYRLYSAITPWSYLANKIFSSEISNFK